MGQHETKARIFKFHKNKAMKNNNNNNNNTNNKNNKNPFQINK